MKNRKILILGIGNVLQQDDGIGIKLLEILRSRFIFPDFVELLDGGTSGSALASAISTKDWVIVLDALGLPGNPGGVRLIQREECFQIHRDSQLSPHEVNFLDLIQLLDFEGTAPKEISIIGVIAESTATGTKISDKVNRSIEGVIKLFLHHLKEKGVTLQSNPAPNPPNFWWEE